MCNHSMNIDRACNRNRNAHVFSSRENTLNESHKCLGKQTKLYNDSSTAFNVERNNYLNSSCRGNENVCRTSLQDITCGHDRDYLYREPWSSFLTEKLCNECNHLTVAEPVVDVHVARRSNRSPKFNKSRSKRRCKKQHRDTNVSIKRDTSEMICGRSIDNNNENFANYLENYRSKDSTSKTKLSNLLSKDCPNCGLSPSCSLNISNSDLEAYADPNAYSSDYGSAYRSNKVSCQNCVNCSPSLFSRKYPTDNRDWSTFENYRTPDSSRANLQGCCCSISAKRSGTTTYSQECTLSKSSLFVETGESVTNFSRTLSVSSTLPDVYVRSKESTDIEGSSMTRKEHELTDSRSYGNVERTVFGECKIRCKGEEPGASHCSHFIPKERYSCENATWNQLKTVESNARRSDYEWRENISRRDAATSSSVRSIDKRLRYCKSRTRCVQTVEKDESKESDVPRNCESSTLFGDFEIGKVWSRIQGACKNIVQSAITNVGQAIKEISKSRDSLGDCKEDEISAAMDSYVYGTCSGSCRRGVPEE